MGYWDELPRATCAVCGQMLILIYGRGWVHEEERGEAMMRCECGYQAAPMYYLPQCPKCGAEWRVDHIATPRERSIRS